MNHACGKDCKKFTSICEGYYYELVKENERLKKALANTSGKLKDNT